ncbi:hypothetical protein DID76_02445 [Candidatus Marinamargulisbacteria bacterium SCGC AG-414-C22]|nr:hypothetical protein DID76_02445 [Candidatus Marinamargulisbacteria bacterium SCGC AG-414-C22]
MNLKNFERNRLKKRVKRFQREGVYIQSAIKGKFKFYFFNLVQFPFHFVLYCFHVILFFCFRFRVKQMVYRYLKFEFMFYFRRRSMMYVEVYPLPKKLPPKTIIFTPRISQLLSPFLVHLFKQPVQVPVQKAHFSFPLSPIIKKLSFGRLMDCLGYHDRDLQHNLAVIKQLLHEDKPLISFLNKGFGSPSSTDLLLLYKEVLDFVRMDLNCYFLKCNKFEFHSFSHSGLPGLVSVRMISKSELFADVDMDSDVALMETLLDFYEFRHCDLV